MTTAIRGFIVGLLFGTTTLHRIRFGHRKSPFIFTTVSMPSRNLEKSPVNLFLYALADWEETDLGSVFENSGREVFIPGQEYLSLILPEIASEGN
jgi:hypothetical protein